MALEDFTTYTEVDPNGRYAVAANQITVTNLNRDDNAFVYSDKGAGHFGTTFVHNVDGRMDSGTSTNGGIGVFWDVSNTVADAQTVLNGSGQIILVRLYWFTTRRILIQNGEPSASDQWIGVVLGTWYYCTAERTGDTTFEFRIYSDSGRTTLIDTLTLSITVGRAYRYVMGANSFDTNQNTRLFNGAFANLDLNEAVNRRRRMLICGRVA